MINKKLSQSYINFLKREYIYFKKNKNLKVEFKSSNKIVRNYSQILQDIFVLTILDGKQKGTYVEVGSSHPFRINNTYLLEKYFNWKGLGYEIDENYVDIYNKTESINVNYKMHLIQILIRIFKKVNFLKILIIYK